MNDSLTGSVMTEAYIRDVMAWLSVNFTFNLFIKVKDLEWYRKLSLLYFHIENFHDLSLPLFPPVKLHIFYIPSKGSFWSPKFLHVMLLSLKLE